jgi:hypothetical protein
MISSEEFQQALQSGQIHQALALLVRDTAELDITTRLADDNLVDSQTNHQHYLRTKINFLTGKIENEVGQGFVANCADYLKLQQLHIDQVVASDRAVQGYFEQIKAILTTLAPTTLAPVTSDPTIVTPPTLAPAKITQPLSSQVEPSRLSSHSLIARLTEAAALSANSTVPSSAEHSLPLNNSDQPSHPAIITEHLAEDIDLLIEAEGEVWEEWVEDEDFGADSATLFQPALSMVAKSDSEENWIRRHLNSIDLKSSNQPTSEATSRSHHWAQFTPDCLDVALQPRIIDNSDVHR